MTELDRAGDLVGAWRAARDRGERRDPEDLVREHPELADELRRRFAAIALLDRVGDALFSACAEPSSATADAASNPSSVLSRLLRESGATPVALRGEAADPAVTPRSGREGRYEILGEIARGGVGVVLKGHDVELGRDVAMKVLREEHAHRPEVVERFVEEAQIGGQLQHPGIVPVYEIGVGDGNRPFFAMKLVRGRTLAALLGERATPSDDRGRFVQIFESICQTVAYAHSRGVVHRDLKPANVMVGAFGEVLVVDWGMGKVLAQGAAGDRRTASQRPDESEVSTARSDNGLQSVQGSVIGTLEYMPPEQATGEVDRLDERADVFALGAILCEILTRKPPYQARGETNDRLSQLEATRERIRRCGADRELVDLAHACLAAEVGARPRDAGVVAREVTSYRTATEERAQAARVEAASAEVRAKEERRRRKATFGFACAVLCLFVVGVGGWRWVSSESKARSQAVARQVAAALEETATLRASASSGSADATGWAKALASARRAEAIARTPDADPLTRARTATVLAEAEAQAHGAEAAAQRVDSDRRFVARFQHIREAALDHKSWTRLADEYRDVMQQHGVEEGAGDVGTLVSRLRASPIHLPIVVALDQWLVAARAAGRSTVWLEALLAEADSDPWRSSLRAARSIDEVRRLSTTADYDSMPADTLLRLADVLQGFGDVDGAADVSRRVQERHPGHYFANREAAARAGNPASPRLVDALRYATAALALRPDSARAQFGLGLALSDMERFDPAVVAYREAIRREPEYFEAHCNMGRCLIHLGDLDGAVKALREAIRIEPSDSLSHGNLSVALRRLGDVEGALAESREAVRLAPDDAHAHSNLGTALLQKGLLADSIEAHRTAARLLPGSSTVHDSLGTALAIAGKMGEAIRQYRHALELDPKHANARANLALALLQRGDPDAGLAEAREAVRTAPNLAFAHHALGQALLEKRSNDEAISEFREAIRLDPRLPEAHYNLGNALAKKGDFDSAVAAYRVAIRNNPSRHAYENLAEALLRLGRKEERDAVLREARECETR